MGPEIDRVISQHENSINLLVLETDDPHPETRAERGGFGDILHEVLREAGQEHDPPLDITTGTRYIVEDRGGQVPSREDIGEDVHAILITGSEYDAHGEDTWVLKLKDLIQELWLERPDIRFSGICFGHQILSRALGARIRPHPENEWELSHSAVNVTPIGARLFQLPKGEDKIHLHQMHIDQVTEAPPSGSKFIPQSTNVHVWGHSEHTQVQGLYIQKRLFTTQGHMEFNETNVKRQIQLRIEAGTLKEEDADEAHERAEWLHDGLCVAQAVLRFFYGEDDAIE